jgi:Bacterial regulatory proteins, lacI family
VPRPRRVTTNDIAAATGYASSTVSRALSRPNRVNTATRASIEEVARSLDYVPNTHARALTSGRTETIAVLRDGLALMVEGSAPWQACPPQSGRAGEETRRGNQKRSPPMSRPSRLSAVVVTSSSGRSNSLMFRLASGTAWRTVT